jgi:hypothetical protein
MGRVFSLITCTNLDEQQTKLPDWKSDIIGLDSEIGIDC